MDAKTWTVTYTPIPTKVIAAFHTRQEAIEWCARLDAKNSLDMIPSLVIAHLGEPVLWDDWLRAEIGALTAVTGASR